jgi:exodeoxyribonuclease VII small subunit
LITSTPGAEKTGRQVFAGRETMATTKSFETALKKLEQSVEQLESGELSLDEALKVFSVGVKQADACRKSLREVELKVAQLLQTEDGDFVRKDQNDA